jgi:hypothetical protein
LEDDVVTIYSGAPGGHTTKGTKIAKNGRHVRADAGALNFGVRRKRSGSPLWLRVVMSNKTPHGETSQSAERDGALQRGADHRFRV